MSVDLDAPCSMKEALAWWKRSTSYGYWMKRNGFKLVGGRTTRRAVMEFTAKCPNPCSKKPRVSKDKR